MAPAQLIAAAARGVASITTVPRALTGIAVARIGVGISQASLYLTDYAQRHMLHGPAGVFPRDEIAVEGTFNLYVMAGSSLAAFEVVYHLGLALCIALTLGFGGRLTIVGVWATSWSLWAANPMLIDGGDNLAMIVLPMLALTLCCERLSLRLDLRPLCKIREVARGWFGILLNNAAAFGIMIQLCIVYFLSGMYKAQGDMWVDGTALYYIMRTPEYFFPPLTPFFLENDALIVGGTYAAMIVLIGFPFLVLSRATRVWAVAAMMGFHASIGLFMGLTSFALVMMACDCVFVSGHLQRGIDATRARVRRRLGRAARSGVTAATVDPPRTTDPVPVP